MPTPPTRVLFTEDQIRSRIAALGAEITAAYPDGSLILLGVLKGSFLFLADLARAIDRPLRLDFIGAASYDDGTESSGKVRLTKDADEVLEGAHVLVVEDIVDTGQTLEYLLEHLRSRKPRSLRVVALLDKPGRRRRAVAIHHVGFQLPDVFVVGFGMDYAGDYRTLRDIRVLEP